ncbi:oxidoreductase [Radicibacter daui]|uniref:oxidoreductase n=1 Tax=Radicibacter daui TaxID=3064829 RepID=UPI00404699F8
MIPKNEAVWFITGCSRGLGRAIAREVLKAGYRTVITARQSADTADLIEGHAGRALALGLDVTDKAQIDAAVTAAIAHFGRLDVLVNNAGYGYLAAIEEGEDIEARALFEADLFGPLDLIKAVLPGMRARRQGHIVNITSIGGLITFPAVGYYHMAKFALEALSDTLAKELAPLNIGVTAVAPGAFRTEFRGPASMKQSAIILEDYAETAGKVRAGTLAGHGKQAGDPARGARAIIKAVEADRPPVHLLIGGDALDQYRQRMESLDQELKAWEAVTRSTDLQDIA